MCQLFVLKKSFRKKRTTSSPSTTVPPAILETTPNGSSFGSRAEFRRAIYRSSPIVGSDYNEYKKHICARTTLTCGCVCRHVDGRISVVDNIVVCQGGCFAGHLDVVAYTDQNIFQQTSCFSTHHSAWQTQLRYQDPIRYEIQSTGIEARIHSN